MCPCVIPIVVVSVLNVLLGMVWYSPLLLGNLWAKGYKFDKHTPKPKVWRYLGGFLVSLITVFVFALFMRQLQINTWQAGAHLALYIWIGFVVTNQFSSVLWARKPLSVFFIDIGYRLVSLVMIGIILALSL